MSHCIACGEKLETQDIPVMLCPKHYFSFFTRWDNQFTAPSVDSEAHHEIALPDVQGAVTRDNKLQLLFEVEGINAS